MKKSQHMPSLAQENDFSPLSQFAEAGNKHSKTVHLLQKSVINMI
jgi:hypothetical protein